MNKKLYSDRTVLYYLSHMDLLPSGQLLGPEIGYKMKDMDKVFNLWLLKGTYIEFSVYINPWKFREEKSLHFFTVNNI